MGKMEMGAFFVNIMMKSIAIASSLISFLVYKENSSPDVIMYLEKYKDARSILNLMIKIMGRMQNKALLLKATGRFNNMHFQGESLRRCLKGH